jgi:hypothetical protein
VQLSKVRRAKVRRLKVESLTALPRQVTLPKRESHPAVTLATAADSVAADLVAAAEEEAGPEAVSEASVLSADLAVYWPQRPAAVAAVAAV